MPDNKLVAKTRLHSLKRKLVKNGQMYQSYTDFIDSWLQKGYARKIPQDKIMKHSLKAWYPPHHAVLHPKKSDKLRVVFDAASACEEVSLKNQLQTGPDWATSLIGILIRFRQEAIV